MGTINGTFIYNGKPQNGATAKLWKIVGFASYADSGDTVQDNPLAATSIELNVSNGGNFAVGDIIKIENELLFVRHIATNKLYVIRGYRATTPAEHAQTTQINDETITRPQQDDDEPDGAHQEGSEVTTGVAYGGDGAYRWKDIAEGEYFVSVYYDYHRSWLYCFIERDDVSPELILTTDGDLLIRDANTVTRLPKGAANLLLKMGANRPEWATHALGSASHAVDTLANLNAKISDATLVDTANIVLKALFDANTILKADTDNTPSALAVAASRILGRKATGGIAALTIAEVLTLLLTTKGDLMGYSTTPVRIPVGSDGQSLEADSGVAAGVKWTTVAKIPAGIIVMWHGLIANIPSSWVICDGNGGTPNLLARFVEGVATAATNPGATGGTTSKTTSGHTHTIPTELDGGSGTAKYIVDAQNPESESENDTISDIRPLYYDVAFLMKT